MYGLEAAERELRGQALPGGGGVGSEGVRDLDADGDVTAARQVGLYQGRAVTRHRPCFASSREARTVRSWGALTCMDVLAVPSASSTPLPA